MRSGRDELMWVVIHMCIEATVGISLYSYLYLKLAKTLYLSYYLYVFSSTKLEKRVEQVPPGSGGSGRRGYMAQTMYIHVSKYKNGKIKEKIMF
jgi:hypothetical protein